VSWRNSIENGQTDSSADLLREELWLPIERVLPEGTRTVLISADGALALVPWAAIPGEKRGSVLLEKYGFGVVPYGALLLESRQVKGDLRKPKGLLLAVGDVQYGGSDAIREDEPGSDQEQRCWHALPGTKREIDDVVAIAGARSTLKISGVEACPNRVLKELPKARWAHFATHGYFLGETETRATIVVHEMVFEDPEALLSWSGIRGRTTMALQNPLTLSGLVLAGANEASASDSTGVLSAEEIASLSLEDLELVVVSACQTSVGLTSPNEGAFALPRAFHLAGVRNVVSTLWKIEDKYTAAVMRAFYHGPWTENKAPIEALRQAQLFIFRNPDLIDAFSTSRGIEFDRPVRLHDSGAREPGVQRTDPRLWAAFTLSGPGF
jgi:CHAT domain-containing protein